MVVQATWMAHRLFQPTERDRPSPRWMPFVSDTDAPACREAFAQARAQGSEVTEVVFTIAPNLRITGDLHIARIRTTRRRPRAVAVLCAVIDQGPAGRAHAPQQTRRPCNSATSRSRQRKAAGSRHQPALDAIICGPERPHHRVQPTAAALFQCSARKTRWAARWSVFCQQPAGAGVCAAHHPGPLGEMTA